MAETIRCGSCGALNPANAEWCGQCLTRFRRSQPPPPPPPARVAAAPAHAPADPGAPADPAAPATVVARGAFTVRGDAITWRCALCETDNPLDAQLCTVCGASFAATIAPPEERPQRDPNSAAMYSLFLPGAGHWYLGLRGQGIARAILSIWVVLVALVGGIIRSVALALPFGIVAFALWGIAAHDAYREARREPAQVILKGKLFVYLVLGLLMLMIVLLVSTGLRAGG